jgi:hypothetical protein
MGGSCSLRCTHFEERASWGVYKLSLLNPEDAQLRLCDPALPCGHFALHIRSSASSRRGTFAAAPNGGAASCCAILSECLGHLTRDTPFTRCLCSQYRSSPYLVSRDPWCSCQPKGWAAGTYLFLLCRDASPQGPP